jgi:hypothetical protein
MSEYDFLRTNQSVEIYEKNPSFSSNNDNTIVFMPPYNSDIQNTPTDEISLPMFTSTKQLPEQFSWAISTENDSPEILQKKKLIDGVRNQYLCGSCYAITLAQVISDCHVVSGAVSWAPNISATSIMACHGLRNPCNGGKISRFISHISRRGVQDQTCIDYSWCSKNPICNNRNGKDEFNTEYQQLLNDIVPNKCGCISDKNLKYLYKCDKGRVMNKASFWTDQYRNIVKNHILEFGPVIGSIAVYPNFSPFLLYGNTINQGVYFENANYNSRMSSMSWRTPYLTSDIKGFHSFSIMGWGIAKNIETSSAIKDVPYWHCRNSYGRDVGNEGYFKLAMHPHNLNGGQTDVQFSIGNTKNLGGIIMIKCTDEPTLVKPTDVITAEKSQPDSFYEASPEEVRVLFKDESIYPKNNWLPLFIITLMIIFLIIMKRSKRRTFLI